MRSVTDSGFADRSEPVAVMQDVGKTFDEFLTWSLKGITFGVRRGEVFGLVGPSGSGKTTVIKLLAGCARPSEGKVRVLGGSPRRRAIRARVGYLPEMSNSSGPLNTGGFMDLFRRAFGRDDSGQNHAGEASGAKLRWQGGLAQTVFGRRDLILFDNPFLNLDRSDSGELKDLIRALAQKGKTVMLTSNSLCDVMGVCHRTAILHDGRTEAVGTFDELLDVPNAVRALAPVLPEQLAARLQGIISEHLTGDMNSGASLANCEEKSTVGWEPDSAQTITSTSMAVSNNSESSSPTGMTADYPGEESKLSAGQINHKKLTFLLQPKTVKPLPRSAPKNFGLPYDEAKVNEKLLALLAKTK